MAEAMAECSMMHTRSTQSSSRSLDNCSSLQSWSFLLLAHLLVLRLPARDRSRKRRGFGSRIASSHGIVAWLLFLATLIYTIKTRSALTKELAELKQFSSSTESETFDKMSKMTQQIADKNREIGDLNKTQRSNQKRITGLESEKTALQANIQAAKDETARCTQREVCYISMHWNRTACLLSATNGLSALARSLSP